MVLAMAEDPRFGEILSVAEGLDAENIKKAIRKSRVVFNRGGADEQVSDPGAGISRQLKQHCNCTPKTRWHALQSRAATSTLFLVVFNRGAQTHVLDPLQDVCFKAYLLQRHVCSYRYALLLLDADESCSVETVYSAGSLAKHYW
jgi:hypothetical protein